MLRKQTASLRQAVSESEDEGKEIIKEIIQYLSNDKIDNKRKKELEELVKIIVQSIKHFQRTNSLTSEAFTKLNNDIDDNEKEIGVLNYNINEISNDINNVWTNSCNLQYQIEFIEKLLEKDDL